MTKTDVLHYRGRVAGLSRDRLPDDPELLDAKRRLRAAGLSMHIAEVVDQAPPLSQSQRDELARQLRGGDDG